jgi:hypothetical protein
LRKRRVKREMRMLVTVSDHSLCVFCRAVSHNWFSTKRAREIYVNLLQLLVLSTRRYSWWFWTKSFVECTNDTWNSVEMRRLFDAATHQDFCVCEKIIADTLIENLVIRSWWIIANLKFVNMSWSVIHMSTKQIFFVKKLFKSL